MFFPRVTVREVILLLLALGALAPLLVALAAGPKTDRRKPWHFPNDWVERWVYNNWLVVWNLNFMTFHSVGNHNPN